MTTNGPQEDDRFPLVGMVRRVRRIAVMSQRELAKAAGVSQSTIARIEAGDRVASVDLLERILAVAELWLVVADKEGRVVMPMRDWDDTRDGANRRYPSHLDLILDPEPGEWWADIYGLSRPPETFHRDRAWREVRRARMQWEVRPADHPEPPPPWPEAWWRRHRGT